MRLVDDDNALVPACRPLLFAIMANIRCVENFPLTWIAALVY
ncbi:hypothetical protein HMPREF0762_02005 [Slackia exigua ATCC 700122]|uniref:Uncharacterized protein n=1 Tax=Slackia exigua (strain ATCC 700122 / DSM 15923 / CIP 105133 / JCM 11022 / KCTC 5966 / S-7) TaxID=649764 RepID=D0WJH8_SLAES|nr:hypothetical protein HMPREF0762_02005 [Slackia exigua ATCC 700122]